MSAAGGTVVVVLEPHLCVLEVHAVAAADAEGHPLLDRVVAESAHAQFLLAASTRPKDSLLLDAIVARRGCAADLVEQGLEAAGAAVEDVGSLPGDAADFSSRISRKLHNFCGFHEHRPAPEYLDVAEEPLPNHLEQEGRIGHLENVENAADVDRRLNVAAVDAVLEQRLDGRRCDEVKK